MRPNRMGWKRYRIAFLVCGVFLLFVIIREYYDPFLSLYLDDVLHPKPPPLTALLTSDLALRVYGDTRPHVGKIDLLQKGLVLVYGERPLIEEAYGFGLPIVISDNQAYNARHAEVLQPDPHTLVKRYHMDTADRWSRFLRVKYQAVDPLGTVVCTYTIRAPDTISVTVDFTGLHMPWDAAYVMNEQGARSFPLYEDSAGQQRHGDALGIWHPDDDVWGCWLTQDAVLRFCVETEAGRRRFVGRERYNQYNWVGIYTLSWAGIDIEIAEPLARYSYVIRVSVAGE